METKLCGENLWVISRPTRKEPVLQSPDRTDGRYPSPGANHPRIALNTGTTTTCRTLGQLRRKGAPLSLPPPDGVSMGNSSYRWLYPIECKQGLLECFSVYAIEFSFQRRLRAKSKGGKEGDSGHSPAARSTKGSARWVQAGRDPPRRDGIPEQQDKYRDLPQTRRRDPALLPTVFFPAMEWNGTTRH